MFLPFRRFCFPRVWTNEKEKQKYPLEQGIHVKEPLRYQWWWEKFWFCGTNNWNECQFYAQHDNNDK